VITNSFYEKLNLSLASLEENKSKSNLDL